MFSHIFIGVADFDRALAFYQPVMAALGIEPRFVDASPPWAGWQTTPGPRPLFLIGKPWEGAHAPLAPIVPGMRPRRRMSACLAPGHAIDSPRAFADHAFTKQPFAL